MGKGGNVVGDQQVNTKESIVNDKVEKKTLMIDGITYDVTNFHHPGGSIIKYLCADGVDATDAFREFHWRSEKAKKYLKSLPVISNEPNSRYSEEETARRTKLSKDFLALRNKLEKEGYFNPSYIHVFYRLTEIVVLFLVSFYMISLNNPVFLILGIVLNGIAQGRCGWEMHEMGHLSALGKRSLDIPLQQLVYGFGCGMSASWWSINHNKHHAVPQKLGDRKRGLGGDVDLDTLPLLAFNKAVTRKIPANSFMAKWISFQAYLFAPISCFLVGMFWTLFLHPRHIMRKKLFMEAFWIATRYISFYLLVSGFGFTTLQTLGVYLATFACGCDYIFLHFALSHTHLDVSQADEYLHWVDYSAKHTTNISINNPIVTWVMSYLNFQIEHHLFPQMPEFRHPKIAPLVKELFESNGLVYDERPYFSAMYDTFRNLHEVGAAAVDDSEKKHN